MLAPTKPQENRGAAGPCVGKVYWRRKDAAGGSPGPNCGQQWGMPPEMGLLLSNLASGRTYSTSRFSGCGEKGRPRSLGNKPLALTRHDEKAGCR